MVQGRFHDSGKNLEREVHSIEKRRRGNVSGNEHNLGEASAQVDLNGAANNTNSDADNKHNLLSI